MKYTALVLAVAILFASESQAVIINQTMSQVSRNVNLTNEGIILREPMAIEITAQKNETSNITIGHNESKQVGNTRFLNPNGAVPLIPE